MFNLFGNKKSEQQIVAEIHNEFDTAGEGYWNKRMLY